MGRNKNFQPVSDMDSPPLELQGVQRQVRIAPPAKGTEQRYFPNNHKPFIAGGRRASSNSFVIEWYVLCLKLAVTRRGDKKRQDQLSSSGL